MKISNNKVSLIICARNEKSSIAEIINNAKKYVDEIIIIVCSLKDETADVAEQLGAKVLIDNGKGKGAAMRTGLNHAFGEIVVFMDADGSHNPDDIPRLVAPIIEDKADMIIGSRSRGGSDELHGDISKFIRMIGSDIITLIINYRWNVRLTDSQNGFKAIKKNIAKKLHLTENIFTIEQEMIMKCLKNKYKILEVPAHEYERKYGRSNIVVWRVWPRYIWCLMKNLF